MANTRERVKDFPSIVGTIQSDDYFPVDGVTQGVRKAQVSDIMNAPLSGLATAANTVKGAINEVATTAGKQDSMTQDEYDALPSSKESDNVARYITDGTPSTEDPLWAKVGTDRLDTEAPDCSGAINELKQSLSNLELDDITLSNQTTNSQGMIVTNLNFDGKWVSAYVSGGRYASFRPSGSDKLVIRLINDNGEAVANTSVNVTLYHLGPIS